MQYRKPPEQNRHISNRQKTPGKLASTRKPPENEKSSTAKKNTAKIPQNLKTAPPVSAKNVGCQAHID